MEPVKILFGIDSLVRGGTELQLKEMISRIDRDKYIPYLITIQPTDASLTPKECIHIEWDIPKLISINGFNAMLKLSRLMRDEKIQVVQTFFQDSTIFVGLAAWIAGVQVRLASCRDMGFWHTTLQGLVMKVVYRSMTGYICNARIVRDHFIKQFKINVNKAYVLPNGVDEKLLPYVDHIGPVTDIGIVGNMTRQVKRIDLFIKAASLVAKEYPNIRWHIVGDGYLRPQLEVLAAEQGVRNSIVFAGRVDNVTDYLQQLQIGVICSDSEGLSNAIIEYMFRGVAAVVTDVGGNPELVQEGKTGMLVPPDDAQAIADKLKLLIRDTELRRRLAISAREHVEKNYSWDKCLNESYQIYTNQLSKKMRNAVNNA